MSRSHRWSNGSVSCRLEWRPSRLLQAALVLLGGLAALSVLASEMPRPAAWPSGALAAGYGMLLARREGRRPRRQLWFPGDGRAVMVDGKPVEAVHVAWRGPLAFVKWREVAAGSWQRLAWWPDTLPARTRRELRLAAGDSDASRRSAGMAP
ncbi:hypothetical protein [Pseudoxanthomonas putridarboris]|uniref:Toxin CptA n=1 Tax=Pseudoxanthomonas putridarboris TaxID=752605 RepID=A0ABU9J0E6_9GAMM